MNSKINKKHLSPFMSKSLFMLLLAGTTSCQDKKSDAPQIETIIEAGDLQLPQSQTPSSTSTPSPSALPPKVEKKEEKAAENKEKKPSMLYKVISVEAWKESQGKDSVILSKEDADFIHFATRSQLSKILEKYWKDVPEYVVLKIRTDKLPGNLVFEANPEGETKYYHLYNGSIPSKAVMSGDIIQRDKAKK